MKTIREAIADARAGGYAIPHFNVTDLAQLRAVTRVAQELDTPILVGVSEGERDYIGVDRIVSLVRSYRAQGVPIFLNADHTHSVDRIEEAARAGFDAVLFDGGKLAWEDNLLMTKAAVAIARSVDSQIVVEGEMGYIGSGSSMLDALPEGADLTADAMTDPEKAATFARETGVDLLAPAVGNIHGMLKAGGNPHLDVPRIAAIELSAGVGLVLHGGSGTPDEDLRAAAKGSIAIAHISTELRRAWRQGMEAALKAQPDEVNISKLMRPVEDAVYEAALSRAKLFLGR